MLILREENYSEMSKREKFEIIHSQKISQKVFEYLKPHFDNLKIQIYNDCERDIFELMYNGALVKWCWQTTETAILFLEDNNYIERGTLKLDKKEDYYHSWIIFIFKGIEYVFDPCLQILCEKDMYYKIFEVDVKGRTTAKLVREYFINYINNPPQKKLISNEEKRREKFNLMIMETLGESDFQKYKSEIVVYGKDDVNAPIYRNGVGYRAEIENEKVKKLVAHYFFRDF